MKILVTGGAGFIGTHTLVELLEAGKDVVVMDNFSNSKPESLARVKKITGKDFKFYEADMLDTAALDRIFEENPDIGSVVHFAGLKAVGESCEQPMRYYTNNISGTLKLLDSMNRHGVKKIVFSSSATVYGLPKSVPIKEDFPLKTYNPYGETKLMTERILSDIIKADPEWCAVILRYFNPIGAHSSGLIGEDPKGIPNNLFPYITQVGVGKLKKLRVFGDDYPTHDGTGVRDYIHVADLANAHLKALEYAEKTVGIDYFNIGTGKGYSVLDMVKAYERITGKTIAYEIVDRRPGDIAECYADPTKAKEVLNWTAKYGIDDMCRDADRWQTNNPEGYTK
ncbi:MAG: UDP-glucose 4-epimerase GalE [Ruminococcaceae bacterium]|nr:UDP-glucose 4-epimerase GalE [Oscillospiraceae bacterium]